MRVVYGTEVRVCMCVCVRLIQVEGASHCMYVQVKPGVGMSAHVGHKQRQCQCVGKLAPLTFVK